MKIGVTMKTKHATKQRKAHAGTSARRKHRKSRPTVDFSLAEKSSESRRPLATLEFIEEPAKSTQTQSGDLTGIPRDRFSAGESMAELIEEGQDLEGELVGSLGTTREGDEGTLSVRNIPRERIPDYKNRNRL
jgi:hypothetical protein